MGVSLWIMCIKKRIHPKWKWTNGCFLNETLPEDAFTIPQQTFFKPQNSMSMTIRLKNRIISSAYSFVRAYELNQVGSGTIEAA